MKYNILGSSSKGNSIIVEDILCLDVGISYTKIKDYLSKVKLIFISHIHKDHLNPATIKQLAYNFPNMKFLTGSKAVVGRLVELHVSKKNIFYIDTSKGNNWFDLGLISVKLEPLAHDVENYCLHFDIHGKKGIYIVDTNNVDNINAKNYALFLVENNYQESVLKRHIQECVDEGQLRYLNRVPHTHLSAELANSFLIENMGSNSEFCYIHQSSYNFEGEDYNGNI